MSRFHQKIGTWLGLFAILMATLAPTISQTLAARDGNPAMSGEHCDMPSMSSMSGMHAMSAMRDMPHDMTPGPAARDAALPAPNEHQHQQHTSTSSGDACGYCSLLAHMPAVVSVKTLFVVTVRAIQQRAASRFERVRRAEPLPFAQPRAPPSAS
ncbi:MAG TPA: DUF2946 domain-containing protein [Paraburkholderia sp.]|nr:DUF2946 domain-containing protein [Paraburkholderia sp.]